MLFALRNYGYSFDMYGIMDPNFLTKMARPRSKLGLVNLPLSPPNPTPPPNPWDVGCRVVSRCIVLEVRSAVADENANEFYNYIDL